MDEQLRSIGQTLLIVVLTCVALGVLLLALVYSSLRRLHVPEGADFVTTLRAVPLGLVVALDLLDLGLDVLALPIVWVVLSRFRLQALRNVAAVEALIPFTQPIPTLTLSWLAARMLRHGQVGRASQPYIIDTEEVQPGEFRPRARR